MHVKLNWTLQFMPPLGLAKDVYFAVSEGQGIFLDLKRDDYVAIPMLHADTGDSSDATTGARIASSWEVHCTDLMKAGLLIDDDAHGADPQAYQRIVRPSSHILHPDDQRAFGLVEDAGGRARIPARDWIDVWSSLRAASRALATEHISDTVKRVRTRKTQACGATLDDVRRHAAIFRKLRPWYARPYLCLFDALALVEFLARRGVAVDWIFGVQAQPFGAHCWVQFEGQLLNESTEYALQFTPIMIA